MNAKVFSKEGKETGSVNLPESVFGVAWSADLVHEVVLGMQANARGISSAHTKGRGEVSGGGKKPWKQKGTGRARQGSTRSPQWVGGGITFGPTSERNFSVKINKKAKKKALFMSLSDKVASNKFFILESVNTGTAKTKIMADLVKKLPVDRNALLVVAKSEPMLMRMVRNLQNIKLTTVQSVNILDVLTYRTIIFVKDAVPAFEQVVKAS